MCLSTYMSHGVPGLLSGCTLLVTLVVLQMPCPSRAEGCQALRALHSQSLAPNRAHDPAPEGQLKWEKEPGQVQRQPHTPH